MESVRVIKESRTVILNGEITDSVAADVCFALLQLESENPSGWITLMINSPGGSVHAGWQIVDTIKLIGNVETINIGLCGSMAAIIHMAGDKGYRLVLPHAKTLLHQPLGGAQLMQASDFEITAREMARTKKELYTFISECTGKTIDQVTKDCDRDYWLDADESVAYGLADRIVTADNR